MVTKVSKVSTHKFDLKIASVYVFIEGSNDKVSIPEIASFLTSYRCSVTRELAPAAAVARFLRHRV